MIATVVKAAGKYYSGVIYQVTKKHEAAGTKVTLGDLFEAMVKDWRIKQASKRLGFQYEQEPRTKWNKN